MLEAILFTTSKPLTIEELHKIMRGRRDEIEKMLLALKERYANESSGVSLSDIGGYKLVVKNEYLDRVSNLTPHADLSRGLLRVLSIIAYHEPIPQSEIVKVIGNRTYEYVKDLETRGLVRTEKKSRTKIIRTTPHFEEYFGTRKEEIRKLAEEEKEGIKEYAKKE